MGTSPPTGVEESWELFTAPVDVAVVVAANNPEAPIPNRVSLPSMFPPGCVAEAAWSAPARATIGLPCCSAPMATATEIPQSRNITAKMAQPCRREPTMRP